MKHNELLEELVAEAESDPNTLGFLLFGSVATGTHREDSDIDVITALQTNKTASGISNTMMDDIKVGNIFFTYDVLAHSVETVPYLLHPLGEAKLLFDREGTIEPLLEGIRAYFAEHPEMVAEWDDYYALLREEKPSSATKRRPSSTYGMSSRGATPAAGPGAASSTLST